MCARIAIYEKLYLHIIFEAKVFLAYVLPYTYISIAIAYPHVLVVFCIPINI